MFERFTDRSRRCVVLAQEEARLLNHGYIGSEHALLGVLAEGQGMGAQALRSLDVSVDAARAKVVALVGRGDRATSGHIPFTPQAKRALEAALREALHFGDHEIDTEHLLLGLIRDGESTAARVLTELRVDLDAVRTRVTELRAGHRAAGVELHVRGGGQPSVATVPFGRTATACSFCGRDLWEVTHYVRGDDAVICDVCAALASEAVQHAESDVRPVRLPPRVFGAPPDEDALDAVIAAVELVFMSEEDDRTRAAALEDGERLAPLQVEARRRHANLDIENRLDRIRFVSPDVAEVRLTIGIFGGPGMKFEGPVRRVGGAWKVSRELFCAALRPSGVHCPDPDDD